jgi:RimJ/RimL family protein N-acetyltransferase
MAFFVCSQNNFIPAECENVLWLDKNVDYELARMYWQEWEQTLAHTTWKKAHEYGYRYAAIIENNQIISSAGVWQFSENWWEVVAVSTLENRRRKGYSKSVVAFITSYILKSGHLATCSTDDNNFAMIATAKSLGFQQISPEEKLWSYPELPDF